MANAGLGFRQRRMVVIEYYIECDSAAFEYIHTYLGNVVTIKCHNIAHRYISITVLVVRCRCISAVQQ
jgi:hypothetical protein